MATPFPDGFFLSVYLQLLGLQTTSLKSITSKLLLQAVNWDGMCPETRLSTGCCSTPAPELAPPRFWDVWNYFMARTSCRELPIKPQCGHGLCSALSPAAEPQGELRAHLSHPGGRTPGRAPHLQPFPTRQLLPVPRLQETLAGLLLGKALVCTLQKEMPTTSQARKSANFCTLPKPS